MLCNVKEQRTARLSPSKLAKREKVPLEVSFNDEYVAVQQCVVESRGNGNGMRCKKCQYMAGA